MRLPYTIFFLILCGIQVVLGVSGTRNWSCLRGPLPRWELTWASYWLVPQWRSCLSKVHSQAWRHFAIDLFGSFNAPRYVVIHALSSHMFTCFYDTHVHTQIWLFSRLKHVEAEHLRYRWAPFAFQEESTRAVRMLEISEIMTIVHIMSSRMGILWIQLHHLSEYISPKWDAWISRLISRLL